jgi:hypothetical protein
MPKKTARRRTRALGTTLFVAALGAVFSVFMITSAGAVHDIDVLELKTEAGGATEANIADDPAISPEADWGSIFTDHDGSACVGEVSNAGTPAPGQIDSSFVCDFEPGAHGPDPTFHEPSNQDPQAINPAAGSGVWGCTSKPNPVDKDDIVNAYAIAVRSDGDLVLYWGTERFDNSGAAFIGIWFFQEDVGCEGGKFTGKKTTGDVLVVSDYTNGGVINSLQAFKWTENPADPDAPGTFTQIAPGPAISPPPPVDCDFVESGDSLCANVNTTDVTTPWPMEDKEKPGPPNPDDPRTLEVSEFFEGGINITDVFTSAGLSVPECFGSFLAETRTAPQLESANLTDFALGDLKTCAGAISITKNSPKGPVEGVTFEVRDPDGNLVGSDVTDVSGVACVGGLDVDVTYTVTEIVPTGYRADSTNPQTVLVDQAGTCESGAETVSFDNTPLTDLLIQVAAQAPGATASTIDCGSIGSSGAATDPASPDVDGLDPGTYTCTIVIDP